jgi:hypothetical protein
VPDERLSTLPYTWRKVPVVDEMERMLATTLPALILGGEAGNDVDAAYAAVNVTAGLLRKDHSLV